MPTGGTPVRPQATVLSCDARIEFDHLHGSREVMDGGEALRAAT